MCVFPVEEEVWLSKERVGNGHSHDSFDCLLSLLILILLVPAVSAVACSRVAIRAAEYCAWFSKPLHLYLPN